MYQRDLPSSPWELLGSDIFDFNGNKYLAVGDYYSKFPIIRRLSSETSSSVIKELKSIFSEQGIPKCLYTDNGPCYASSEFHKLLKLGALPTLLPAPYFHNPTDSLKG